MNLNLVLLKRQAKRHLLAYRHLMDEQSGGHTILQHVSSSAREHAQKFNTAMDALAKLDKNCPKDRLPVVTL